MSTHVSFENALAAALLRGIYSEQGADNHDADRFGEWKQSLRARAGFQLRSWLRKRGFQVAAGDAAMLAKRVAKLDGLWGGLAALHGMLADEYSKSMLVQVLAMRVLGRRRVKLPVNNAEYWRQRRLVDTLAMGGETIPAGFQGWQLRKFDLNGVKLPIQLFLTPSGVLRTFLLRQYEYHHDSGAVAPGPGDVVVDGGGCWGDTALYFANLVGGTGRVCCYEFVPDNLAILRKNFELNPELAKRVLLLENALLDRSGGRLYIRADGPASTITTEPPPGPSQMVETLAIDDLVAREKLPRVDFIKLDIEGAELKALQGARETILKHRPKLAVALYHDIADFAAIPAFLRGLGVNYRYHLDHFTIHEEETILFAVPE